MGENYLRIQRDYLSEAYSRPAGELEAIFRGTWQADTLHCTVFGQTCAVKRDGVFFAEQLASGPRGLLVALYAVRAKTVPLRLEPLRSFKELPGSMPYQGAFRAKSEIALLSHVPAIQADQQAICARFGGAVNEHPPAGDFSFTLYPLPLVPLYYIFHLPDDEFPASVSCLFAANALDFMPLDGLADVGEYTAKALCAGL